MQQANPKLYDLERALNEVISADARSLDPGYQIGHSYFVQPPDESAVPHHADRRSSLASTGAKRHRHEVHTPRRC